MEDVEQIPVFVMISFAVCWCDFDVTSYMIFTTFTIHVNMRQVWNIHGNEIWDLNLMTKFCLFFDALLRFISLEMVMISKELFNVLFFKVYLILKWYNSLVGEFLKVYDITVSLNLNFYSKIIVNAMFKWYDI